MSNVNHYGVGDEDIGEEAEGGGDDGDLDDDWGLDTE